MKQIIRTALIALCAFSFFSASAAGGKLISKAIEETLEAAAKRSGRVLTKSAKRQLGKTALKMSAKYGDDILPLIRKGGLEVLEQGARHGDDFWRLCKAVPEASRSLAMHTDDLLPLARRIGPEVLEVEAHAPGMAVRVASEFGDDGIRLLAKQSPQDITRLVGYAAKADSPATKKLLYETYAKSKSPSAFLQALNWKNIMAGGLTTAAIVSAYKVSDGVQQGLKDPQAAENVVNTALSPLRYGLYALFAILLIPLGTKSTRWAIAAWKKNNNQKNP